MCEWQNSFVYFQFVSFRFVYLFILHFKFFTSKNKINFLFQKKIIIHQNFFFTLVNLMVYSIITFNTLSSSILTNAMKIFDLERYSKDKNSKDNKFESML